MVRHFQSNVGGFAGNFTRISVVQTFLSQQISITSAAAPATNRLLLINPPGLDGGLGLGLSL